MWAPSILDRALLGFSFSSSPCDPPRPPQPPLLLRRSSRLRRRFQTQLQTNPSLLVEVSVYPRPHRPPAMEMEVGGPGSRKRKSAALEPPAPEETYTEPTTGHQGSPPGVDDGGADDRISHLPDAVLGDIISLLPTKDGARTQVLASRWRHLWRSAPLNLDRRDLRVYKGALDGIVSRILSAHAGPGRRFCAPVYHLLGDRAATADAWLLSPALDNLQELELCSYDDSLPYPPAMPLPPPAPAFRFSRTLRVATIGDCHLTDGTAQALHFPNLKQLALGRVSISECSLQCMVAGCPALECLLIHHSFGFRCLRINSHTLRGVGVRNSLHRRGIQFEELIIENAPCLERLLALGTSDGLHISVISAPKLETLGCLSDTGFPSTRLVFDSTIIQGMRVDSLTAVVCTVKILAVDVSTLSLDAVIDLMRCFPCLEKLYIQSVASRKTNLWRRKHRNLIRYLDIRLKTIVWQCYRGIKSHVNFATFFILNARVLELMTLQVRENHYNQEFFAQQYKMLQLENKVSGHARLHFTTKTPYCDGSSFRVDDLDLTDPFLRKDPISFCALS